MTDADLPFLTIPPIEELAPLADPIAPTPEESDTYVERTNVLINAELVKLNGGPLRVIYPGGGTDVVQFDEDGDIEVVTDWAVVEEATDGPVVA